jgi:hypothetical protein
MSNTKHTPGPWEYTEQGEANNYRIMANGNWLIAFLQNGEKWTAEQEANARHAKANGIQSGGA